MRSFIIVIIIVGLCAFGVLSTIVHGPPSKIDYPDLETLTYNDFVPSTASDGSGVNCDTTEGSPHLGDIDIVIQILENRKGKWCINENNAGSRCTNTASWRGLASVSLCGKQFKMKCEEVAEYAKQIKKQCAWSEYSGGRYLWPPSRDRRIALHMGQ